MKNTYREHATDTLDCIKRAITQMSEHGLGSMDDRISGTFITLNDIQIRLTLLIVNEEGRFASLPDIIKHSLHGEGMSVSIENIQRAIDHIALDRESLVEAHRFLAAAIECRA